MSTDMLATGCVLLMVTLVAFAGMLSLKAATRDEKPSRPVLWGEDD